MKRPEGFDPQPAPPPAPRARASSEPRSGAQRGPTKEARQKSAPTAEERTPKEPRQRRERVPRPSRSTRPDAGARAELRRAARERRRAERAEVRRFTRRARNRRVAIAAVIGTVATLLGLVLTAVYSPILALREVRVEGTSRVSAEEVAAALDGQLGVPLALLDFGAIETELGAFPLIRSYVTETLPPDTLVIHVVEREPVGSVAVAGGYQLVDPAGIVLQESVDRIPGVPLIDLAGAVVSSPAFDSAVQVLLSLPPALLAQVDTISAHTQDDVTLVLAGVGQRVAWGSADDSVQKAALLAALIAVTDPAQAGEFDVSAPSNGVFRPA